MCPYPSNVSKFCHITNKTSVYFIEILSKTATQKKNNLFNNIVADIDTNLIYMLRLHINSATKLTF